MCIGVPPPNYAHRAYSLNRRPATWNYSHLELFAMDVSLEFPQVGFSRLGTSELTRAQPLGMVCCCLDAPLPFGSVPLNSGRRAHAFAADSYRRSFAALAVSRNSGSESFRHRSNSSSRDFSPNVPIAYAPQDLSQGSSLLTSAATACSRFSILAWTCRFARRARSPPVILSSRAGTSMSRSWDFKTLSRNSNALSCTATLLDCKPR